MSSTGLPAGVLKINGDRINPATEETLAAILAATGGSTQYTEGDTDASFTGTMMLMEDSGNTASPLQGSVADGLLVNLGANNDTTPAASATVTGLSVSKTDAQTATVTAVKAGSGRVYGYHIQNPNETDAYLHFYNIASGSVTVGSSTRTRTLWIPAGGAIDTVFTVPISFSTAISIAATTTITGSTAPSTGLLVNIDYI